MKENVLAVWRLPGLVHFCNAFFFTPISMFLVMKLYCHIWRVCAIPAYGVYQLYDTSVKFCNLISHPKISRVTPPFTFKFTWLMVLCIDSKYEVELDYFSHRILGRKYLHGVEYRLWSQSLLPLQGHFPNYKAQILKWGCQRVLKWAVRAAALKLTHLCTNVLVAHLLIQTLIWLAAGSYTMKPLGPTGYAFMVSL